MKKCIAVILSFALCVALLLLQDLDIRGKQKKIIPPSKKAKTLSYITQVNVPKVWKEKDYKGRPIKGEGVKVAVIDDGFDTKHPDFIGIKWTGYDFVRKSKSLTASSSGHGTHVAGIIKRVAPKATFLFYRVVGNVSPLVGLNLCQAMEQAMSDGANVINLSLGAMAGEQTDIFKRVINKAAQKGVVIVVAAGNEGPLTGTMGSLFANSNNVITVGASTKEISIPTLQMQGDHKMIETVPDPDLSPPLPTKGTYPILNLEKSTSLTQAKGKLLLVKRGKQLTFKFLVLAKKAGAIGVIGVNHHPGEWYGTQQMSVFSKKAKLTAAPFVSISGRMGDYLKKQIDKGNKQVKLDTVQKERMTSFSSKGPSITTLKNPDVVAPGENIYSSFPVKLSKTGHKVLSGTSMAAPIVSGSVALLRQMHPAWTPRQIKAALANNAVMLRTSENARAPFLHQGSGRIDVWRAIHTESFFTPNQLRFGKLKLTKTKNLNQIEKMLYIENASDQIKWYKLKLEIVTGRTYLQMKLPTMVRVNANTKRRIPVPLKVLPHIPKGIYTGSICVEDGKEKWKIPFSLYVGFDKKTKSIFDLLF